MTTLMNIFTLAVAIGYLAAALIIYHKVLPRIRDVSKGYAVTVWLLATGMGWFGVVLFAEILKYGILPEARLLGHLLFQTAVWTFLFYPKFKGVGV